MSKTISEFMSDDVRAFSIYNCERSIPSVIDGFKPSQRKVIFGMRKKYSKGEVKVSVAAAGCQEVSAYHHGSIEGVMIGLAQGFTGSNNIQYLDSIGQFGSRISPEAAASRYIFTKLTDNFSKIFPEVDEKIINFLEDDGMSIEPTYYLPIIPNILVNGSSGMGTGFACQVLAYNPQDLIKSCLAVLDKKPQDKLIPWYRGFTGLIQKTDEQVIITGNFDIVNSTTLKITELPIGVYTTQYRETLNKLEDRGIIKTYDDNSSEDKTEFIVTCPRETLKNPVEWILKTFGLIKRETENLTLWNENSMIVKFESPEKIVSHFTNFRCVKYERRRQVQLKELQEKITELTERIRFIRFYIKNSKWFSENNRTAIEELLIKNKFVNTQNLMQIRVYNLTHEQIVNLENQIADTEKQYTQLKSTTAEEIYRAELKQLAKELR